LDVFCDRGFAKELFSDGAKEFVSVMLRGFLKALGIKHYITNYNAGANAMCERQHVALGEALRILPTEVRRRWSTEVRKIAFAINSTVNAHLTMSPFRFETGEEPNLLVDLPLLEESAPPTTTDDALGIYGLISSSITQYQKIARTAARKATRTAVAKLNTAGPGRRTYEIGAQVIVYVPKSDAADVAHTWKQKHHIQWRGPCTVVDKKSKSTYVVRDNETGRQYSRSVNAINPYVPPVSEPRGEAKIQIQAEVPILVPPVDPTPPAGQPQVVGSIVAVKDDEKDKTWFLAKVTALDETGLAVQYYATTQAKLAKAKFRLAFIETKSGRVILGGLKGGERGTPWDGIVPDDLVVATNIKLRADGTLTAASLKQVLRTQLKHSYLK
jgi:hypothetical protein